MTLAPGQSLHCYETLIAESDEDYAWPEFDELTACRALLHVRHHGAAEGRAV